MRTVAFADDKVVDLIHSNFIAVWHNQSVESVNNRPSSPEGAQPKYTEEELELYPEGGGGNNVLNYFCDAKGRVLHLAQGWWRVERFLEEVSFAQELLSNSDNREALEKAHLLHKNAHASEAQKIAAAYPDEMKKPFPQSKVRRLHAALGLQVQTHETASTHLHRSIEQILQQLERSQIREIG
jgi:hypothetical protein